METFYFLEKAHLSLSNEELIRFEKFLHSPYFTNNHANNEAIKKLFKRIKPLISKKCNLSGFDWIKSVGTKFSNKTLDTKNVSKIKSELLSYLLNFFSAERLLRKSFLCKISVLEELNRRNLDDCFRHYCTNSRFNELNTEKADAGYSFQLWRLVKTLNRNKEKGDQSFLESNQSDNNHMDYQIEKHLLRKCFKEELTNLQLRNIRSLG